MGFGGRCGADRPARQAAPAARGGKVRARPGSDTGRPVKADVAAGAALDLVDRGLAHAQPHDCDRPAQRLRHSEGRLGRAEGQDGHFVLGQVEWNGLVRIFEIDDLGHQPALVDRLVQVILIEDHADRVFGRVDALGPMEVPDELNDRIEVAAGAVRECR